MLTVVKVSVYPKVIVVTGTYDRTRNRRRYDLVGTMTATSGNVTNVVRGRTASKSLKEQPNRERGVWGVIFENDSDASGPARRVFRFQLYNSAGQTVGNPVEHTDTESGAITMESINIFEPANNSTVDRAFAAYGTRGDYAVVGAEIEYADHSKKSPDIDPPFDDPFTKFWYTEFYADVTTPPSEPATLRIWDEMTPPSVAEHLIHIV